MDDERPGTRYLFPKAEDFEVADYIQSINGSLPFEIRIVWNREVFESFECFFFPNHDKKLQARWKLEEISFIREGFLANSKEAHFYSHSSRYSIQTSLTSSASD